MKLLCLRPRSLPIHGGAEERAQQGKLELSIQGPIESGGGTVHTAFSRKWGSEPSSKKTFGIRPFVMRCGWVVRKAFFVADKKFWRL